MKMPTAVAMAAHLEIERRMEARMIKPIREKRCRKLLDSARFYAGLLPVYYSLPLRPLELLMTT